MSFPTTLSVMNVLQKQLFHGQEYRRAAAASGPLSYCFGMATSGKPSTWFPLGELVEQSPPPADVFKLSPSDFLGF